jgi:hypothetical protein
VAWVSGVHKPYVTPFVVLDRNAFFFAIQYTSENVFSSSLTRIFIIRLERVCSVGRGSALGNEHECRAVRGDLSTCRRVERRRLFC